MNSFPYQNRALALEIAFGLYLDGVWSHEYVVALYRAEVPIPELAEVRWMRGPGRRFNAYIFTPNADIPLRPRKPRNA